MEANALRFDLGPAEIGKTTQEVIETYKQVRTYTSFSWFELGGGRCTNLLVRS